jgi:hypothetical protein
VSNAIDLHRGDGAALAMVSTADEARARLAELQDFVRSAMIPDVDYGKIPGTGDKPTLLQPGAQKLCEIYGLAISFEDAGSIEDWERGFFAYKKRCVLTRKVDGAFVGSGVGSCNSREERYGARWVAENEVPSDLDKSKLRTREREDWVFESAIPAGIDKASLRSETRTSKKGKPYRVYQVLVRKYQVPNEKIFDLVNTMEKIACKRALVMASIGATRSSQFFTQDIEDSPETFGGRADVPSKAWPEEEQPWADEPPPRREVDVDAIVRAYESAATVGDMRAVNRQVKAEARDVSDADKKRIRAAMEASKARLEPPPAQPAEPVVDGEIVIDATGDAA